MDILAASCRIVFEVLLVVKYFGATEDDAHMFLLQAEVDRILIHEGFLEWNRIVNPRRHPAYGLFPDRETKRIEATKVSDSISDG
jgi:hypothetical protein